jgi:hypothetical protein
MKITKVQPKSQITFKTKDVDAKVKGVFKWWEATTDRALCDQLLTTTAYLKESQQYLQRQTALYARLYGNMSLFSFVGSNVTKMDTQTGIPADRPTFNLVQSCVDTLVSRISQSRPAPVFLTEAGDYKERRLAKQLNNFVLGEFYQTKAYEKAAITLRDACVTGTGILKVYETEDHKVALDRVLRTELLIDSNDGMYGDPRAVYQMKLVDRDVLKAMSPKYKSIVEEAASAYPDNSSDSAKTTADMVMVVESWHLPSSKKAKDGRHVIACSSGILLDEEYNKDKFPFIFLNYSPKLLGFWAQGLAEQLMGTQMEINSILFTISRAIKLVGVPRVFVESGSKVAKASFNNDIGAIIEYKGIKPSYEVAQAVPQELYSQLQRMIDYGYQQSGVSALQASSEKPAGLNSGEAIRSYDDISTDRLAALSRRYDNFFIDLAYAITDKAMDIAKEQGSYQTVYPGKDGTKTIDLPSIDLIQDPFVIQCFNQSSLPKDPAGRMQKVTEMISSGMLDIKEGRRLLDFPDLGQVEQLENASEERIFQILDKIVEDGDYTPPDSFMDLQLASKLTTQYYNLYVAAKLEEERAEMLRTFFSQIQTLVQVASTPPPMPPGAPGMPPGAPQGVGQVPAPSTAAPPQQMGVNSAAA